MPIILPQHIAFILDGNRRWAKARGKMAVSGHRAGAEAVETIALRCQELGIRYATFWALSTENLRERSSSELRGLYAIIDALPQYFSRILEHDIRINTIGDLSALPSAQRQVLSDLSERSRNAKSLTVTLAINYGGRDEIVRAIRRIVSEKIPEEEVTEKLVTEKLDTAAFPDPDLIVRTGGRHRLSGYLPWQSVYAELYFTDVLWPDFDAQRLDEAIAYFQGVQRNFGR